MNLQKFERQNLNYLIFFLIFWGVIFSIEYLYRNNISFFLCNDSYQYLSIAHNIFLKGKISEVTNYAHDLYYDEIALFGYDLTNIKPYHFPSYSVFLSLFYHIYDNHIFVSYASQYIAFIIFSFSSFLILSNYLNKNKALLLTILSMISTSIILYISESGKEIFLSGLSLLVIYLTLYCQKIYQIRVQILLCFILTFISITRYFYLLLAFLIFAYHAILYLNNQRIFKNILQIITFGVLTFVIPLCAYIYFYHFEEFHLFIADNRTDIYGGKTIRDLLLRIITNLFLGILYPIVSYFQFILFDKFSVNKFSFINYLYYPWFLALMTMAIFFYEQYKKLPKKFYKKILNIHNIKIPRLFIINSFFAILALSIICRFSANGYRLILGLMPIIYCYLYQRFFYKKNLLQRCCLIFLLVLNCIFNISFMINSKKEANYYHEVDKNILENIHKFNAKKIVVNNYYTPSHHLTPMFHLFKNDIFILSNLIHENLCDDLANYHQHYIDFDLIFLGYGKHNIKDSSEGNCDFILKNYHLADINKYGLVYARNPKK